MSKSHINQMKNLFVELGQWESMHPTYTYAHTNKQKNSFACLPNKRKCRRENEQIIYFASVLCSGQQCH